MGHISSNPVRSVSKPSEPRGRVRYLSKDELAKLSDACKASRNPFLYTILVLAVSTGMRLGEIRNLRKSDVDLPRSRIILQMTKNGERRAVPLAALALEGPGFATPLKLRLARSNIRLGKRRLALHGSFDWNDP